MMKIIGITGGVGSGKSAVLSYLEETYHAYICQADHVAWQLQMPGENCYEKILTHFGTSILHEDQTINRRALGRIVFSDPKELDALNEIMQSAVKEEIRRQISVAEQEGIAYFIVEAALLLEFHYEDICDEFWYIYTEAPVRRARLKASRGYTDEKIDLMMRNQLSDEAFFAGCQVIIPNSGSFEETKHEIDRVMKDR